MATNSRDDNLLQPRRRRKYPPRWYSFYVRPNDDVRIAINLHRPFCCSCVRRSGWGVSMHNTLLILSLIGFGLTVTQSMCYHHIGCLYLGVNEQYCSAGRMESFYFDNHQQVCVHPDDLSLSFKLTYALDVLLSLFLLILLVLMREFLRRNGQKSFFHLYESKTRRYLYTVMLMWAVHTIMGSAVVVMVLWYHDLNQPVIITLHDHQKICVHDFGNSATYCVAYSFSRLLATLPLISMLTYGRSVYCEYIAELRGNINDPNIFRREIPDVGFLWFKRYITVIVLSAELQAMSYEEFVALIMDVELVSLVPYLSAGVHMGDMMDLLDRADRTRRLPPPPTQPIAAPQPTPPQVERVLQGVGPEGFDEDDEDMPDTFLRPRSFSYRHYLLTHSWEPESY